MKIVRTLAVSAAVALAVLGSAASAQDSSYVPGTVWNFSYITVEPGQFENYMDYLSKTWKKSQDFGMKEGDIVSYHVFQINNSRAGEPDLVLAIETKDYLTNAQQLAVQKKFEKFMAPWDTVVIPAQALLTTTNLTGNPQVVMKCGFTEGTKADGAKVQVPRSISFLGKIFDEGSPLRVALAYEQATDWHRKNPTLES